MNNDIENETEHIESVTGSDLLFFAINVTPIQQHHSDCRIEPEMGAGLHIQGVALSEITEIAALISART